MPDGNHVIRTPDIPTLTFDQMFDMAVECGAAINIANKAGLTPLTMAAYLARLIYSGSIQNRGTIWGFDRKDAIFIPLF